MKKLLFTLTLAGLVLGNPALAATKAPTPKKAVVAKTVAKIKTPVKKVTTITKPKTVTNVAVAKGQKAPPAGYLELISQAHTAYLAASAKAKASKSKTALEAAEKAYSEAMEKASSMLGG